MGGGSNAAPPSVVAGLPRSRSRSDSAHSQMAICERPSVQDFVEALVSMLRAIASRRTLQM